MARKQFRARRIALLLAMLAATALSVFQARAFPSESAGCDATLDQAQAALEQGNAQEAEAGIRSTSPECRQSARAVMLLGASLDEQGKQAEAQRAFLAGVAHYPSWASLRDNLGISYLHSGKNAEALAQFRAAIRIDPQDRMAILNLAECLLRSGRFEAALDELSSHADEGGADPEWLTALTEAYLGTGKEKQAVESAHQLAELAGNDPKVDFSLGLLFAKHGQNQQAVEYFMRIPEDSRDFATYFDLGLAYAQLGKLDDASAAFNAAIQLDTSNPQPYLELATIDVEKNSPRDALLLLAKAHEIAPARVDVTAQLAELLIQTERLNDAEALLSAAIREHPSAALLKKAQGDLYNRQNLDSRALTAYHESLKADSKLIDSHIGLARVYQRMGQSAEARTEYAQVLHLVPTCAAGNSGMGALVLDAGHTAQAIPYLKEALDEQPGDIDTGKSLANAYIKMGEYEKADQILKRLMVVDPENSQIHYLEGRVLMKLNRSAEAQEEFSKAAKVLNTPPAHPAQPMWFASSGCSVTPTHAVQGVKN